MLPENCVPTLPPLADVPSVDAERMEMLRDLCSETDPALLTEMLSAWENEASRRLTDARAALTQNDAKALKSAAHALKGSCANIGVVRLSEMSRYLEREAHTPSLAAGWVAAMEAEFRRVQEFLAAAHASA